MYHSDRTAALRLLLNNEIDEETKQKLEATVKKKSGIRARNVETPRVLRTESSSKPTAEPEPWREALLAFAAAAKKTPTQSPSTSMSTLQPEPELDTSIIEDFDSLADKVEDMGPRYMGPEYSFFEGTRGKG